MRVLFICFALALQWPTTGLAGNTGLCDRASRVFAHATREKALKAFGNGALAYLTEQPGMDYFDHPAGYIAFNRGPLGIIHSLGDPVADPTKTGEVIDAFLKRYPKAVFWNITADTGNYLASKGYYVNGLGKDMRVDLKTYTFAGGKMESMRRHARSVEKLGYQLEEKYQRDGFDIAEAKAVTESWLKNKVQDGGELRFFTPPIDYRDQVDVRKFYLKEKEGKIVGLYYFYPYYRNGEVIGYSLEIRRSAAEAPMTAEDFVFKQAVELFQKEGKEILTLGMMPLHNSGQSPIRPNPLVTRLANFTYNNQFMNQNVSNLKNQSSYKQRFKGEEVPLYFATRSFPGPAQMLGVVYLSDALPLFKSGLKDADTKP